MTPSTPICCKGFLRQTDDGKWVLSKQPDVKSCCLLKQEDITVLEGDFSHFPTKRAVKIKGIIIKDDPLTLDQVSQVQQVTWPYMVIGTLCLVWAIRRFVVRLLPLP